MKAFIIGLASLGVIGGGFQPAMSLVCSHHHRAYCVRAHEIRAHFVHDYTRKDGTFVSGHFVPAHMVHGYCVAAA